MLENTFQHGGKQIKTRNLFFSKPPRPSNKSGIQFRFTLCETDYGVHIKRLFLEKILTAPRPPRRCPAFKAGIEAV